MITDLRITGFRNIKSAAITPALGINLFIGNNGAGKTNTLEAIGLFSIGKSCRRAKDGEMLNFDADLAEVIGTAEIEKKKSNWL